MSISDVYYLLRDSSRLLRSGSLLIAVAAAVCVAGCDMAGSEGRSADRPSPDQGPSEKNPLTKVDSLETDRLVGTHYYLWWGDPPIKTDWLDETPTTPVLGAYDSQSEDVINQHVKWALEHGIRWFSMSWWGPDTYSNETLRDHFLTAENGDKIEFSILYETIGRFGEGRIDMSDPADRDQLERDLSYLADTYFSRENYLRIDGRPVIFIYLGQLYGGAVAEAFEEASTAAGVDPYVIADLPFGSVADVYPIAKVADAVTTYNPYVPKDDIEEIFQTRVEEGHALMHLCAEQTDMSYLPVVIPGFDDTEIEHQDRPPHPILEATPARFERVAKSLAPHLTEATGVLVTSFNEWFENTSIEPSEEHGTAYLKRTADHLATGPAGSFDPEGLEVQIEWEHTQAESERNPDAGGLDRQLALRCMEIYLMDADGNTIAEYEIGRAEKEPLFSAGAYGMEEGSEDTWRWLGGPNGKTHFLASGVDSAAAMDLVGVPVADMEVSFSIGGRSGTAAITEDRRVHRLTP